MFWHWKSIFQQKKIIALNFHNKVKKTPISSAHDLLRTPLGRTRPTREASLALRNLFLHHELHVKWKWKTPFVTERMTLWCRHRLSGVRPGYNELRRYQGSADPYNVVSAGPGTQEVRCGKHLYQEHGRVHWQQGAVRHLLGLWQYFVLQGQCPPWSPWLPTAWLMSHYCSFKHMFDNAHIFHVCLFHTVLIWREHIRIINASLYKLP